MPDGGTDEVTVAVKVTFWFRSEGFTDEAMVVVVAALSFVRLNDTVFAPLALAVTLYEPAVTLAIAPPPVRTAEAFTGGAVKVMMPPLTGSPPTPMIEVIKGAGNAVRMVAFCGVPLTIEIVKPRDSKAPMSTVPFTVRLKPAPR